VIAQARIIWFGLFVSTFIYAGLDYMIMAPRTTKMFDESLRNQYTIVLYAMAAIVFVVAMVLSRNESRPPMLRMILSMALYESCAIFGLVAAFLVSDWRLYVPAWVLCLIGFARMFPAREENVLR
jgi:hypothetical protein